jgi:hypothetical protein
MQLLATLKRWYKTAQMAYTQQDEDDNIDDYSDNDNV